MLPTNYVSSDLSSNRGEHQLNNLEQSNYLGRTVEWVRVDRPAYQQALVYTAVAIVSLALVVSIVGIPIVLTFAEEAQKARVQDSIKLGDRKIHYAIGGSQKYKHLSELRLHGATLNENSDIQPQQMKQSIMRGFFSYDRPFLALKLIDRTNGIHFVQVLFRKYTYEGIWDYARGARTLFTSHDVDNRAITVIKDIVQGRHPRYRLA